MTAQDIVGTVQRIARHEAAQLWAPALATVTSVPDSGDKPDYACTVRLRESGIVLPRVPIATGVVGVAAPPAVGDLVVVLFLGGDLHAPVVVGRLHHRDVPPPEHDAGDVVAWLPGAGTDESATLRIALHTPDGGPRSIEVGIAGDQDVTLSVDETRIEMAAGKAMLTLEQPGSSSGRATVKVGDSSVVIEQGGNVTITASGTLELKGADVKISGDASVKLTGQVIDLN
jgi:uncharacterized protein involved in type VI secretion and phage assembly